MPRQRRDQPAAAPPPVRRSTRVRRKRDDSTEPEENSPPAIEKKPVKSKRQKTAKPVEKQKPATKQLRREKKTPKGKGKSVSEQNKGKQPAAGDVHDKIPDNHEHTLADAHVRSLLPGSFFGLADELFDRGLWSVKHNNINNQKFASSPDSLQFQQEQMRMFQTPATEQGQPGPFEAELRLWEVLQHRFRCGLDDFFRYGLRPRLPGELAGFTNYCAKLTAILVHVMWLPDIAHVRWFLQRVVQERVPGHARPLVPAYSYDRPVFVDTARQWGFDVSMRMSLEGEESMTQSKTTTESTTVKSDNPLSRLAAASREAAQAAIEAEAELASWFFSAHAPRDLWWLNQRLRILDEPRVTDRQVERKRDDDGDDDNEEEEDKPFGLRICDEIRLGFFDRMTSLGKDVGKDGPAVERRGDRQRREDNNAHQTEQHGDDDVHIITSSGELRIDQIFFFLQEEDLDRVLRLLAHPGFIKHTRFVLPQHYYTGYIHAHQLYGHGDIHRMEGEAEEKPMLTCLQCAIKYHQGDHGHEHDHHHDHDDDDSEEDEDGEEENTVSNDGHGHYLFQQFVGDVAPDRALEWLLHRKCEWLLAGCREEQIRSSLEKDKDNDLVLPDIPPFDPPPLAAHDRVSTHPSQLAVLERIGEVPHASVMWCLGRG